MTAGQLRIGIVGAGIGGLTLALALRQRGLTADVYEQASELREIGAAVSLTANGSRELERLGCLDAIAALSAEPTEFVWRGWRDDRRVAAFPVAHGGAYQSRFGAPFCNIHRADLQRVLGGAHGPDRLHLSHRLVSVSQRNRVVRLDFANGSSAEVDILVGVDGQRSIVRRYVTGEERAAYSGTSGFRAIVPIRDLPSLPDPHAIQFWMGRTHTFCTMRSVLQQRTSISLPWLKGHRLGHMRIGLCRSRTARRTRLLVAGIQP